jgi:hypothetical protein
MAQAMVLMQKRMEDEIKAFQGMQKGSVRLPLTTRVPCKTSAHAPPPSVWRAREVRSE